MKILFALGELLAAALIFYVHPIFIADFFIRVLHHVPHVSPGSFLFREASNVAYYFVGHTETFVVFYLASHGIVKIFLLACVWAKQLWSYPLALVLFVLMGVYQIYRYELTGSELMIWLTVLDVLVIWLTYIEYKSLKAELSVV